MTELTKQDDMVGAIAKNRVHGHALRFGICGTLYHRRSTVLLDRPKSIGSIAILARQHHSDDLATKYTSGALQKGIRSRAMKVDLYACIEAEAAGFTNDEVPVGWRKVGVVERYIRPEADL